MANNKGSKATAEGRARMPYKLESVSNEDVVFVFDDVKYGVTLDEPMLRYLLDAGIRTRISAAGAGVDRGLPEMVEAANRLQKGIIGRVSKKATKREKAIAKLRDRLEAEGCTEAVIELAVGQLSESLS